MAAKEEVEQGLPPCVPRRCQCAVGQGWQLHLQGGSAEGSQILGVLSRATGLPFDKNCTEVNSHLPLLPIPAVHYNCSVTQTCPEPH